MTTKERVDIVVNNIGLINRQVQEGNQSASVLGRMYNMNLDYPDPFSVALFDGAFDNWYKDNVGNLSDMAGGKADV